MHELTLAREILNITLPHCPADIKIQHIIVELGALLPIDRDALMLGFQIVAQSTLLDEAKLNITLVDGEANCQHCQHQFKLQKRGTPCPECGGYGLIITRGEEFLVRSIG